MFNTKSEQAYAAAIAETIRGCRKAAGMNQRRLAERVGCQVNTIVQYEAGRREPRLIMLVKMANAFGKDPGDMVFEVNKLVEAKLAIYERYGY